MLVTLDFETFYGKGYTLSSMTNEAYVRDTRFHTHGVGVKIDDKPAQYFWREEAIAKVMAVIPWDEAFLICHNAHFDGSILAWRYGVIPKMYICTKSMGRAVFPNEIASLASLSRLTKIGEKGTELANFYGRERLTEAEQLVMGSYCKNDVELTYKLFQKMKSSLPLSELKLIDSTIRMFTQPIFDVDTALLKVAHEEEVLRKKELLKSIGQDRKIIASNPKFAALLEEHGVVPPKKISPSYVKKCNDAGIEVDPESDETVWTYAFAKSDEEFLGLLEHPDPRVQALVECRLGTKSSIIETRTKRFHDIGTRGRFPVYLNYYGAHTGRWSGGDKQNAQNLNRGSALRKSLLAPEGHVCLISDLAQIEARMLAYWAGQTNVVEAFAQKRDVYSEMASTIFGRRVDRKWCEIVDGQETFPDFIPGFIGKAVVLGCGYGLGWLKFQEMIRVGFLGAEGIRFGHDMADALNVDIRRFMAIRDIDKKLEQSQPLSMTFEDHALHCACAKTIIDTFRTENSKIKALWTELQWAVPNMLDNLTQPVGEHNMVYAAKGGMKMPNGMMVQYESLELDKETRQYTVLKRGKGKRKIRQKIYGGLIAENVVQALCRNIIAEQQLQLRKEGYWIATTTHDEIVAICPEDEAPQRFARMIEIMSTPPLWAPGFPIAAEGGYNRSYGMVK